MNKVQIEQHQNSHNAMLDIDEVATFFADENKETDTIFLNQVREILVRNNCEDKILIALRHNHFKLHNDEVLVEDDYVTTPWIACKSTMDIVSPARYAVHGKQHVVSLWDTKNRVEVDYDVIEQVLNFIAEKGLQDRFEVALRHVDQPVLGEGQVFLEKVLSTQRKTILELGKIPEWQQKWTTYSFKDGVLANCCKECASDAHSRTTH